MSDVRDWLRLHKLEQYADAFAANDVDLDILPELTERDFAELGVSMGNRRRLMKAIAARTAASGQTVPTAVPAPTDSGEAGQGWKEILLRVFRGVSSDRILANAAGVTFYALLALFPAIAALVSIYGLFSDPESITRHLDATSGFLPSSAIDVVHEELSRIIAQPRRSLGIGFLVGLVISLWSANNGIKALFDALNIVYAERETRSFIRLNAVSLTFTVAMIAFLIVAIAGLVALPVALNYLPGFLGFILDIVRWPVLLAIVAVALACTYRYGPDRAQPRGRRISWGTAFAVPAWLGFSALFSYYAANFGAFNKTYGSLGAVIGFMLWIWLSVVVILIGGKLNALTGHRPSARVPTEVRQNRGSNRRLNLS
jgi:membrane protein